MLSDFPVLFDTFQEGIYVCRVLLGDLCFRERRHDRGIFFSELFDKAAIAHVYAGDIRSTTAIALFAVAGIAVVHLVPFLPVFRVAGGGCCAGRKSKKEEKESTTHDDICATDWCHTNLLDD